MSDSTDTAFLLNSSQPDDEDDVVVYNPNSDSVRAAGGIQATLFVQERKEGQEDIEDHDSSAEDWLGMYFILDIKYLISKIIKQ